MTPDERNMLQDLANKVAQTPTPAKDAEAEDFIRKNIGSRPDALYLMTQTVLIQNLALQRAQQQIQELQQRASQPAPVSPGSSFLGGQGARPSGYSQAPGQPYSAPPPPQYAPPTQTVANPGGGASSFLRGAAQTAAGVAGGVLAADAISSLFGHGGGFGGFGGGGFMSGGAPVEEVVNNYYEAPPQNDTGDYGSYNDLNAADQGQQDDQGQYDDGGQYQDASFDSGSDDGGGFDDSGDNFA